MSNSKIDIKVHTSNLRIARKKRGYTQTDVAEALGVSTATYSNIERGLRHVKKDEFVALGAALQVPCESLRHSSYRLSTANLKYYAEKEKGDTPSEIKTPRRESIVRRIVNKFKSFIMTNEQQKSFWT